MANFSREISLPRRFFRRIGYYCFAVVFFIPYLLSRKLTALPPPADFTNNWKEFVNKYGDIAERVQFTETSTGGALHGLFIPGEKSARSASKPCVLLCHGLGGDLYQMLPRAGPLHERGYDVLLFDFRGHGRSGGVFASLGYFEMRDVAAAVEYLRRERGAESVLLYGFSMGAVAAVLAAARDGGVAGIIAESPFDSMESIVVRKAKERYRAPKFLIKLVLWATSVRRGLEYREVDLTKALRRLRGLPILLVGTSADVTIPVEHTRRLAPLLSDGQEYWEVNGAAHGEIFSGEYGAEFERRVFDFLERCGGHSARRG